MLLSRVVSPLLGYVFDAYFSMIDFCCYCKLMGKMPALKSYDNDMMMRQRYGCLLQLLR